MARFFAGGYFGCSGAGLGLDLISAEDLGVEGLVSSLVFSAVRRFEQ